MKTRWFAIPAGALCFAGHAQNFDYEFVTVGDAGNAAYTSDAPNEPSIIGRGAVDYDFRISTTEVTVGDYIEFLNGWAPFAAADGVNVESQSFTGGSVLGFTDQQGQLQFVPLFERTNETVAQIPLRQMARMVNWLNSGRQNTREAFEQGVYDTSTFGGGFIDVTDDMTRAAGARYFIPNTDELIKALYYDENRFGEGEGGWWTYPNSSDEPSVSGVPGEGTTNAGLGIFFSQTGLYPDEQCPWGLLDGSGGGDGRYRRLQSVRDLLASRSGRSPSNGFY